MNWQLGEIERLSTELDSLTEVNNKLREAKGLPPKLPPLESQLPQSDGEKAEEEEDPSKIQQEPLLPRGEEKSNL